MMISTTASTRGSGDDGGRAVSSPWLTTRGYLRTLSAFSLLMLAACGGAQSKSSTSAGLPGSTAASSNASVNADAALSSTIAAPPTSAPPVTPPTPSTTVIASARPSMNSIKLDCAKEYPTGYKFDLCPVSNSSFGSWTTTSYRPFAQTSYSKLEYYNSSIAKCGSTLPDFGKVLSSSQVSTRGVSATLCVEARLYRLGSAVGGGDIAGTPGEFTNTLTWTECGRPQAAIANVTVQSREARSPFAANISPGEFTSLVDSWKQNCGGASPNASASGGCDGKGPRGEPLRITTSAPSGCATALRVATAWLVHTKGEDYLDFDLDGATYRCIPNGVPDGHAAGLCSNRYSADKFGFTFS